MNRSILENVTVSRMSITSEVLYQSLVEQTGDVSKGQKQKMMVN